MCSLMKNTSILLIPESHLTVYVKITGNMKAGRMKKGKGTEELGRGKSRLKSSLSYLWITFMDI